MKHVTVKNQDGVGIYWGMLNTSEDVTLWCQKGVEGNWWGKPERWVLEDSGEDITNAIETRSNEISPAIEFEDGQVQPAVTVLEYKLPADYSIEITDLDTDPATLLEQCYQNRISEYGRVEDQLDEMFHDFSAWQARIAAIKVKYPIPQ